MVPLTTMCVSVLQMVHEKLLQSLRDMMAAEEARLETSAAMTVRSEPYYFPSHILIVFVYIPDPSSSLSFQALTESGLGGASAAAVGRRVLGPVDADTDATITGFVLQQHLPAMLAFLAHPAPQVWHRG